MELEIINKLYLELSQVATAKTAKEIELEKRLEERKLHGKLVQDIFNCDEYDAPSDSMKLAKFYASANPKAVLELVAALEALQAENAEQAKRIAILEQSEAIEVIDLRKENERMKATLTQFSEVLKKHHEQSHYDLVNTLGEILVSAQKGTE